MPSEHRRSCQNHDEHEMEGVEVRVNEMEFLKAPIK